ncbi:hypothetical protein PEX1_003010 [Penicillium expansum]|uniref:Uncharacterized protein n=1 Tax=Penicillium expansum TaxID=27334 RepID=A0A0A2IZI3_PENEN|nr:hypothetical protein PEX2_030660 [Penicillium expansum]KGO48464.1 hypothetical protein PEX1_003010 [Penicillium expansum]KGO48606.1 hypothetical protein PEXP_073360 [Penicillium expansum]KGO55362.1 hypothetical protein PEX2_030660 [Penicillium expansum]
MIRCNHQGSNYIQERPAEVSWTNPLPRCALFYSQDPLVVNIYRIFEIQHTGIQQNSQSPPSWPEKIPQRQNKPKHRDIVIKKSKCAPDSVTAPRPSQTTPPIRSTTLDFTLQHTYSCACLSCPLRTKYMHTAPAKTQAQQALSTSTLALVDSLSSPLRPTITKA